MNLIEFTKRFPTEQSCKTYLKELRLERGIICKKCQSKTNHWWLENIEKFQCSKCNSRTNLKSGTIMDKSKLSIQNWFLCIHLMTSMKKPISCLEMQKQIGYKFYEPVWYMMTKIRTSMGNRDNRYQLQGDIEIDDGFFEVVDFPELNELGEKIDKKEGLTRGRGSERQSKILVMVESRPIEHNKKHVKKRVMGFVKMVVIEELSNVEINGMVRDCIDVNSHVITDGWKGYSRLNEVVNQHTKMIVPPKDAMKKLPWVHTVISNCKRQFLGTHHSIGKGYLQGYLNEFCYKLNRRNFESDMFDRMIICGSDEKWN